MNLQIQNLKHSLKTMFGMIVLATLAAALVSSASISKAQAGKMSGGVKAAPVAMAAKTGPSKFNPAVTESRPSQKPFESKERVPCRRPSCNGHTH